VAKAEEELFFGFDVFEELRDFVDRSDALDHTDDGFVGTAVEGPIECCGCSGNGGLAEIVSFIRPSFLPQGNSGYKIGWEGACPTYGSTILLPTCVIVAVEQFIS